MEFVWRLALLFACASATALFKSGGQRYDGYKVVKILPRSEAQLQLARDLGTDIEVSMLDETREAVEVIVPPGQMGAVTRYLGRHAIRYQTVNNNIQSQIDREAYRLKSKFTGRALRSGLDFNDFNTYEDIMDELERMVNRCPSGISCMTYNAGNSLEGRQMKVLKISKPGPDRKAYWLDSAIHAREWLSPATNLKILDHLISDYDTDAQVQEMLDDYDWYFMPIVNPDGYIYTWESDRLWRKNRNPNNGTCYGVDLNRNFDAMWAHDSSPKPCSQAYHGKSPASEPETRVMQEQAVHLGSHLRAALSIHAFSKMWLMPWGYSSENRTACVHTDDHYQLLRVVNAAADATQARHGTSWTRGNICDTIYPASGSVADYTKAKAGVKYTFGLELRGSWFVVDDDQIQPSYEELWDGIVAMVREIKAIED